MKKLLSLLGVAMLITNAYSQTPGIMPLQIGDSVPDITLNHIVNYKSTSAKLSDFKGKPVIIDFFATWCGSCIVALPHLDALQKKFGDSIQVLVVTYEPDEKLRSFLKSNAAVKKLNLQFITEDTILKTLFPHSGIPHEVVLMNKKVEAITYPEYLTEEAMYTLYSGDHLELPEKRDLLHFRNELPLYKNGEIDDEIIYRSLLTHYLEGFGSKSLLIRKNGRKRRVLVNRSILMLYLMATGAFINYEHHNRIDLEVKDLNRFIVPNYDLKRHQWHAWAKNNCYCYEVTVPDSTSDVEMNKLMVGDLNRYFGLNGRMETRKVKCFKLILTKASDTLLIESRGGEPIEKVGHSDSLKIIRNKPISFLLSSMNHQILTEPLHSIILDSTGYKGNVDLTLNTKDLQNLDSLTKVLAPYGLRIVPTEAYLDMLVISEKN